MNRPENFEWVTRLQTNNAWLLANVRYNSDLDVFARVHQALGGDWAASLDVFQAAEALRGVINIVFIEDYDMALAKYLCSGVDLWLNTPEKPYEASGTSGMKAAHNGVLNFSVLDGWWVEGCIEGVTGWAIGLHPNENIPEAERRRHELDDIYDKLEYIIIPTFYNDWDEWVSMMESSIGKVAYYFNTHRMMRKYATDAYL
jgi:starch phosphorylase